MAKIVDQVDVHVGAKLRVRRMLMGITQEKLAEYLDVSFQQVQRYEKGANRISAGRLHELAKFLNIPVGYFYEDLRTPSGPCHANDEEDGVNGVTEFMLSPEGIALNRAFMRIKSADARRSIIGLVFAVSQNEPSAGPIEREAQASKNN